MKKALAILCLSLLLLAACGSKAPEARSQPEPTPTVTPSESSASADAAVQSMDQQAAEVDTLTQDLDSGNLDQVDADLAAIDNLDLG